MGRGKNGSESILYGAIQRIHNPVEVERLDASVIQSLLSTVRVPELNLVNGFTENVMGFSGTMSWCVRAEKLPLEWTRTQTAKARSMGSVDRKAIEDMLIWLEGHDRELRDLPTCNIIGRDLERMTLVGSDGKPFISKNKKATVEALAGVVGSWYLWSRADDPIYEEIVYLDPNKQLLGSISL